MTRILYDTLTSALQVYPRADDEPVIGLDPRYLTLTVIQQPQPEHDPTTHRLDPTEAIDLETATVTRDWQLVALPPPAPAPDWTTFRGMLLISEAVAAVMATARAAGCEPGVTALPVALERAQAGDVAEFAACWALVATAGQATAEMITGIVSIAQACHLPAEFVAALQPET